MVQSNRSPYFFAAILGGGLPLAGIVLLGSLRRRRYGPLLGLLVLAILIGLPACGGGGHSTPPPPTTTPPGTYQINVTATAGSQSQQEGSFFLVVQ